MANMTRGVALVSSVAQVVKLTGAQDLGNLEDNGELTLTELLVSASDAIYDQIDASGHDPSDLSNAEAFERAVAWHFLATLALLGYLPSEREAPADAFEWSDPYFTRVRPRLANSDNPRRGNESRPAVGNMDPRPLLGGGCFYRGTLRRS